MSPCTTLITHQLISTIYTISWLFISGEILANFK
jgi:hypothetical protein